MDFTLDMIQVPTGISHVGLRKSFEEMVRASNELYERVDLTSLDKGGVFSGYRNLYTQALWVGFVMGVAHRDAA